MLNIVQFIHGLNMGGAETLVKEYALGLDKTKFNLTILCLKRLHTPYENLLEQAHIRIIYLSDFMILVHKTNILCRGFNRLQRYYLSRKYLRQLRPDIVHVHLPLNGYVKFARLAKTTKIFYTQHFDADRLQNYPQDVKALRWLIARYPTQLIALNDTMREQLNQLFGISNTVVLNNGINLTRFKQAKCKAQIRRELGIPQDAFVLGHIGRLNPIKNQSFLIKAAGQMRKQPNLNTWLLLVGDGADRAKLEQEIIRSGLQTHALILSHRTDIPDLLRAMDRFVFPSISEGLGIAVIEAQAAGIPCVVSNAVPSAVQISNLVTFKSLQEPVKNWVHAILQAPPMPQYTHLEKWDIAAIIRQLEELYEQ